MSTPGLSDEGVAHVRAVLAGHVASGAVPGLAAVVAHGEDAHVEVIGAKAVGDPAPLPRDALFRIASLTKPVAALGAAILLDEGVLELSAPVDDLLPELAQRQVLTRLEAELDDTVPAVRAITVDDLLTFRMGFGAVMAPPGTYPIQRAEAALELRTLGPPWPPTPHGPDAWMQALGTLPLMAQPGTQWLYNTGAQVLGVLLARASGQPLEVFLRERIFEPLGMVDTGFSVPAEQLHRFTTAYAPDPATGQLSVLDDPADSWWARPPQLPNAAGWLVSTIDDFWAFARLLVARGRHGGHQIVSEAAIDQMLLDRLTPAQRHDAALFLGDGGSWGLGLGVPAAGVAPGSPGGFGWDGGTGTTWRTNAETGLTGILFTQRAMTSPEPPALFTDFWAAATAALDGSLA